LFLLVGVAWPADVVDGFVGAVRARVDGQYPHSRTVGAGAK
jgi:hypothetical protein